MKSAGAFGRFSVRGALVKHGGLPKVGRSGVHLSLVDRHVSYCRGAVPKARHTESPLRAELQCNARHSCSAIRGHDARLSRTNCDRQVGYPPKAGRSQAGLWFKHSTRVVSGRVVYGQVVNVW